MMRTMSLYESGDLTGEVRLKEMFDGASEIDGESNISIDRLAFLVCRGGWPQAVDMRDEIALDQALDYYDAVVRSDINRADNVQKDPERVKRLMRSYARNQGGQLLPFLFMFFLKSFCALLSALAFSVNVHV